ncbi:TPA: penicillin-binding protein 1A [Candidatus Galligastranaerophilus intestinavium]|uniref:peptidoglycan glycosyltransferase n=1 Tax=Candidatus Galligastranaerophilus intestinavium TaxID=2840836 RepID=A0A9D1FIN7_9BACT|nr:penicillin-binding protein 1A [Candidatus Galligastranaerophilus intestinavium]
MARNVRKQSKKRGVKKRNFFLYFVMMMLSAFLAAVAAFNLYLASLPPISNFDDIKPNPVTSIYSLDGEVIKTFTVFRFEKVSIDDIPADLKNAVISTEDKNFYRHRGFDTFGLVRSIFANIKAGSLKQGASTITQQLARILFLSNERTFDRKIKELIIAHRIEKTISKNEILELYLNSVYLGSGTYGVLSASKTYFDKELDELTLAETALIAGLPQAPSVYSPFQNPDAAINRRNQVLKRMYKTGCITKEQYEAAKKEELHLSKKPRLYSFNKAPYFIDFVLNELERLGFEEQEISQGGLKIYTTLDLKSQEAAQNAIVNDLNAYGLKSNNTQMALFSFSPTTGRIYAYVGGKNYEQSQYDRIVNAIRPPGSAFKPFVYTVALQQGIGVDDIIDDSPISFKNWSPRNYGSKYRGKMPLWKALAISSNVAAVRLIQKTGTDAVITTAREMGITTPLQNDLTISLGSNGVKLYDMVVAYGAFANGGFRVKPYAVERVENSRGVVIYENPGPKIVKVISFDTAAGMTYMLRKVVEVGTGRAANIAKAVAGKTGTTDDYHDAWFMGYTPDIVTGVWLGNDNNTKLPGITGGGLPAKVWADYMRVAITNFADSVFDYPKLDGSQNSAPREIGEVPDNLQDESDIKYEEIQEGFSDEQPQQPTSNVGSEYNSVNNTQNIQVQSPQKPFEVSEPPVSAPLPQGSGGSAPLPGGLN